MIAALFVYGLATIAIAATIIAWHEHMARVTIEAELRHQSWRVGYYRDAYESLVWPQRSRSWVSEAREGYASFATVEDLTGVKR